MPNARTVRVLMPDGQVVESAAWVLQDQDTIISREEIAARFPTEEGWIVEEFSDWMDLRFTVRKPDYTVVCSGVFECHGACLRHTAPIRGLGLLLCAIGIHQHAALYSGYAPGRPWKKCWSCGHTKTQPE